MFSRIKAVFISLIFGFSIVAKAQQTAIFIDKDAKYKSGLELFDKKQFASAQNNFNEYSATSTNRILKSNACFYTAVCGIELFNKDAEWQLKEFIRLYPESQKINMAYFYLGKNNFRKKKPNETIEYFEKVDKKDLTKDEIAEMQFKRGYSYFETNNFEKAKTDFYEIKDIDNKYAFPANYYYSHIAYSEKNYETALTGFNRLVGNETFGSIAPYYITQIYFIQNKYEKVITEAPKLLNDSANIQKEGEINRMIGESYFNLKDFNNALIYLKKTELGSGLNPQGNYALAYCLYKTNEFEKAIPYFSKSLESNDTLAQNAWYHLADCYLKTGDKLKAKNAYLGAYTKNINSNITEDALYSFAKISYELDFTPYNEAVKAFQNYIKQYPNSSKKEECYRYLINVYSTTKNYDMAIKSIESIDNIDPILKVTYQKLIYFKGIENFNNNNIDDAEEQFKKSLKQNSDLQLNALAQYWLAEISYIRKDYTTAIEQWKGFQILNGAINLKEYDLSNYALGYAYFQRKEKDDYTNANVSFRKFLLTKNKYEDAKIADATIRVADCYFKNADFKQASEYYETAIATNKNDVDYAIYQKSLCDGVSKNYKEKINELKKIESRYPNSNYYSAAINEIADTYFKNLKDDDNAIIYYNKILKNYPNSSFSNNAYAQLGNIYFNKKQDEKAFEYFDKFVQTDTKSDAAKEVLEAIKKIFQAKGDVEGMEKYFASVGNPLSENQLEKEIFNTAYDAYYNQKNCDIAMPKWENYISKFPNGKYINEAQFCLAECAYSKNLFEKALTGYLYLITKPRNINTEVALAKASYIYFKDKKYAEALPLFQQLQEVAETPSNKSAGRFGAMRSAFNILNYETALQECNKVMSTEKLSPQQVSEAKYIKAKSLFETNRLNDALIEFKDITKTAKNATGAEAFYHIGKIQYSKSEFKDVDKTVNKIISFPYTNDYWNNKGMLLLADAYIALNENANAKIILQTIIDGKGKQEFIDEAQQKIKSIDEIENQKILNLKVEQTDLKINNTTNNSDKDLFDKLIEESQNNQTNNPNAPK